MLFVVFVVRLGYTPAMRRHCPCVCVCVFMYYFRLELVSIRFVFVRVCVSDIHRSVYVSRCVRRRRRERGGAVVPPNCYCAGVWPGDCR